MLSSVIPSGGVLVDSDVLIWVARGHVSAIEAVQRIADVYVSAISYMELVQGCRNKAELKAMLKTFSSRDATVLPITKDISDQACRLVEQYALSHSVHVADALIAATALTHKLTLLSANRKHFSAITGIRMQVFEP